MFRRQQGMSRFAVYAAAAKLQHREWRRIRFRELGAVFGSVDRAHDYCRHIVPHTQTVAKVGLGAVGLVDRRLLGERVVYCYAIVAAIVVLQGGAYVGASR